MGWKLGDGTPLTLHGVMDPTAPVTRTNLVINPSFETDTTGWFMTYTGLTPALARMTNGVAATGNSHLRVTFTGTPSGVGQGNTPMTPIPTGASSMTASLYFRTNAALNNVRARLIWHTSTGASAGATDGTFTTVQPGGWTRLSVTASVPALATQVRLAIALSTGVSSASVLDFDGLLLEAGSTVAPYFDGTTGGAPFIHAWTGTPHASTSTERRVVAPLTLRAT